MKRTKNGFKAVYLWLCVGFVILLSAYFLLQYYGQRIAEVNYVTYLELNYFPQYKRQYGIWPKDLSEVRHQIEAYRYLDPGLYDQYSEVYDFADPTIKISSSNSSECLGVVYFRYKDGGKRQLRFGSSSDM